MNRSAASAGMVLSADEFENAHSHFLTCLNTELGKRDEQAKSQIEKWIADVVLMNPVYSLRADALQKFIADTYHVEDVREFVFDLGFRFFTTWGIPHGAARLSASLAEGLSQDGPDAQQSSIPQEILDSMSSAALYQLAEPLTWWDRFLGRQQPSLQEILISNKPLLVMYLVYVTHTNAPAV